jgi:hypothetical protein
VKTRENIAVFIGFCILIVLTASIAGCTNSNSGINNPSNASIQPVQTSIVPVSEIAGQIPNQVQVEQLGNPGNENRIRNPQPEAPVSVTINSASKMARVNQGGMHVRDGTIFVVLDITVKNNDVREGFDFTNTSIILFDRERGKGANRSSNFLEKMDTPLENPIIVPTKIVQNDAITGQIIFEIYDSNAYRLNLVDSDKKLVTSVPVNFASLTTASNPVSLTINSVEKRWSLNTTRPGTGEVFVILNITVKNNDLPNGFYFSEGSTTLRDLEGGRNIGISFNEKNNVQEGLENAIILPRNIKHNETVTGKILFGTANSNTYLLNLVDNNYRIILSRTINFE